MFSSLDPRTLILIAPVILLSLTIHEYAHARMAEACGDFTARMAGRVTLNPFSHLDPIGTVMLFFGPIGWARPVPYNPANFRDPRRDTFLVAMAGPASNFILAFLLGNVLQHTHPVGFLPELPELLARAVLINLGLAFFNLLPVPPLDGSRITASLLPPDMVHTYLRMEPYAPVVLLLLILPGFFLGWSPIWAIIGPFVRICYAAFTGVA
jgi:Zn-dependent protease